MKTLLILLISFSIDTTYVVQGVVIDTDIENYSEGYKKCYRDGYCYLQTSGCTYPAPPPSPPIRPNESDTYADGCRRGFLDGLNDYKRHNSIDE